MKICFLNIYSGINNRGAESFTHSLAEKLAAEHSVSFISGGDVSLKKVNTIKLETKSCQPQQGFIGNSGQNILKRFFLDSGSLSVLLFTIKTFSFLWKEKYDVIIPTNGFWQVIICKVIQLFRGSKIIITGHSGPGWDERWNLYLSPNAFIATTEPTAKWAKSIASWVKITTIPYAIEKNNAEFTKISLDLERPIFLVPAAAVPYKRIDLAIKAVAKLGKGSILHLGTGELENEIKKMGSELLGPKRFYSNSVSYDQMSSYYKYCDLVILPSHPQENSPMVFQEAISFEKVVVATDSERNRWVLGEAGVFVDPTNIDEFAKSIDNALKLKPIDFKKELERFSWSKILKSYNEILGSIKKE